MSVRESAAPSNCPTPIARSTAANRDRKLFRADVFPKRSKTQ